MLTQENQIDFSKNNLHQYCHMLGQPNSTFGGLIFGKKNKKKTKPPAPHNSSRELN